MPPLADSKYSPTENIYHVNSGTDGGNEVL